VYSDNGNGSSSRVLSTILAIVSSYILIEVFDHIIKITDVVILNSWLAAIPLIISALVLFFTAPYGVNRASGSITDILNILKGKKNE
jgi:hypothetical protein